MVAKSNIPKCLLLHDLLVKCNVDSTHDECKDCIVRVGWDMVREAESLVGLDNINGAPLIN